MSASGPGPLVYGKAPPQGAGGGRAHVRQTTVSLTGCSPSTISIILSDVQENQFHHFIVILFFKVIFFTDKKHFQVIFLLC